MYKIGICDDDEIFIRYMKRLFSELCEDITFYEYLSGEELLEDFKEHAPFDLLILDILMPGMDGNETARKFRKQFPDTLLIFCSGACMPTAETFEMTPYRFWLKEYTEAKMKKEITYVLERMRKNKQKRENSPVLMVKQNSQLVKLPVSQVYYIAIAKKGTVMYCENENEVYTSGRKLTEVYQQLKGTGFVYAHNSYIVNLKYVRVVSLKELEFVNGKKLTVSRSKAKEFRKAFAEEVAQKYEE